MGLNFSALLRYDGPTEQAVATIADLQRDADDPALDAVLRLFHSERFDLAPVASGKWRRWEDWQTVLDSRPPLPNLDHCLTVGPDFALTFGADAIWVYQSLRWMFFTTEQPWQVVMLDAVRHFAGLFSASECIVTNDSHPAILQFQEGACFSDALTVAEFRGEGNVESLDELYVDRGIAEDWVFEAPDGRRSAVPLWTTHGYWRMNLDSPQLG